MATTEKLPSGNYRGIYRDGNGDKQRTPATRYKQDALDEAREAEVRSRRTAKRDKGTLSARVKWGDWWDLVEQDRTFESDNAKTEEQIVRAYLLPKWENVPLIDIRQSDVRDWVRALERGTAPVEMVNPRWKPQPLSPSYVQRICSPFWVSITAALEKGVLEASPVAGVKLPKRQRKPRKYMTVDEVPVLKEKGNLRQDYVDAAEFILETGLRPGELTGLHDHRVDRVRMVLTVAETYVFRRKQIRAWPKDKDTREIPLSAKALEIYDRRTAGRNMKQACGVEHMRGEKCRFALVFLTELDRPLNREILRHSMTKAAEAAGVETKSGYTLRRGFATRLADGGLDAFQLAELMGHEDVNQSRDYVQRSTAARTRVLAALGEAPKLAVVEPAEEEGDRGTRGTDRGTQSLSETSGDAPIHKVRRAR